jgi:hypothetical protein
VLNRARGEYANLGRPEWHVRPKLLVRRTGDRIVAAFDAYGYYVSNNLFVVLPHEPMEEPGMRAHLALLNSRLMTWYFRTVQPRTGRLFAELKICHLTEFPLPPAARWTSDAIAELARLSQRCEAGDATAEADVDDLVEDSLYSLPRSARRMIDDVRLC